MEFKDISVFWEIFFSKTTKFKGKKSYNRPLIMIAKLSNEDNVLPVDQNLYLLFKLS
jgi:hypothetical protein